MRLARMNKFGISFGIFFVIFIVVVSIWFFQAPLKSGVYPVNQAGLELVEIEEESVMAKIIVPVRWIKAHPWQKNPIIHEISVFNDEGEIFAAIGGEYELRVPYPYSWTERNVSGEIELYLNGARFAEEGSISTTAIDRYLEKEFVVNKIQIVANGKRNEFPFHNQYRYELVKKIELVSNPWEQIGLMNTFYISDSPPNGFIVSLVGTKGHILENISFWLPGMPNNYYTDDVLYDFGGSLDDYMNSEKAFSGEKLKLPLLMEESSILIYFPYTEEMLEATSQSIVRISPNFFFRNEKGEPYMPSSSWMSGPINRELQYEEIFIRPLND